jgi:hypothetical protein
VPLNVERRCRAAVRLQRLVGLLWVAKTSSAHKSLNCSDLRLSCYALFFVLWPSSTPRAQQFATHRLNQRIS